MDCQPGQHNLCGNNPGPGQSTPNGDVYANHSFDGNPSEECLHNRKGACYINVNHDLDALAVDET